MTQPRERSVACRYCQRQTWDVDAICSACRPAARQPDGCYRCCGGHGEHFEHCPIGDALAAARRAVTG